MDYGRVNHGENPELEKKGYFIVHMMKQAYKSEWRELYPKLIGSYSQDPTELKKFVIGKLKELKLI